eukprot:1094358-Rhodomonas_salina.1
MVCIRWCQERPCRCRPGTPYTRRTRHSRTPDPRRMAHTPGPPAQFCPGSDCTPEDTILASKDRHLWSKLSCPPLA